MSNATRFKTPLGALTTWIALIQLKPQDQISIRLVVPLHNNMTVSCVFAPPAALRCASQLRAAFWV